MPNPKTPEPKIKVENLHVRYGDHEVLKGITVDIPEKQITTVIGPSGCGKTTFLRSLNRMIDLVDGVHVSGKVMLGGSNIYGKNVDVTNVRKRMALISQVPNLLPMSIYDNITYGPRINGVHDKQVLDERVERSLRISGLWEEIKGKLHHPPIRLSVGQQQRLCLARALAVEPEVLLCDEPTSALDPISSRHIVQELLALKKDYTIVFVTHILRQAKVLADHVIFFYFNEMVEHGPAEKVLKNPKDPRTLAYLEGEIL
jgi:phosphate transport system ATP-binding protein